MRDADWKPYVYALAWIAFREESLIRKMEAAPHWWAARQVLLDANRYALGEADHGPCRADLRPYIHRVGGPGDTAWRLERELRLGHVRSRLRVGGILEDWPAAAWQHQSIYFGSTDLFIFAPSTQDRVPESEWAWMECNLRDARERFDADFTLHNFQGVWKPIPHTDREPADAAPPAPLHAEHIETRAARLLAAHFARLDEAARDNFKREEADALIAQTLALSTRGFNRVWAEARRRVGMPAGATAGRKRKSPHPKAKSRR